MDMLRVYFEKTDENTDVYFRDKKIWRCGDKYRNLQGKYPVIYLSFKDAEGENWDETFRLLKQVISMEYRRHPELDDPKRNSLHGFYTQIISGSGDESVYMMSLSMLSEMLYLYHGEETVVIIDEYDTPITHSFMTDNYTRCVHFMRNMLSGVLKDNRRLKYGIMSGVLRLAKESIFSGLNNLKVYSILDKRFSEYFGFTEDDVRKLLKCFGREDKFDEVLAWYDGYIFGNTEIFNPWSVLMYISNDCVPDIFWLSTSDNAVIKTIIGNCRVNGELVNLMHGSEVETVMDTAIPYPSVTRGAGASLVMSFLSVTGYLKARQKGLSETGDRICSVMIPNREIMTVYRKEIISILEEKDTGFSYLSLLNAIQCGDASAIRKLLNGLLMTSISFFDTTGENFYHGLMLGLCASLSSYYRISSNRESGNGRYDIMLHPIKELCPGVVFELKVRDRDEKLKDAALEALSQIRTNEYTRALSDQGVKSAILFGAAFHGKKAEVESEIITLS